MEFKCSGRVFEWRGPAPFYFVATSPQLSNLIRERSRNLSYGWGVIHIHGKIKGVTFQTAVIPKEGVYYIPLKDAVRKALDIQLDDKITIEFSLGKE
jgi:hypothetical protein